MAPKKVAPAAKLLARVTSNVNVYGADGKVSRNMYVWSENAPACRSDPDLVFAKCLVVDATDKEVILKQIDPPGDGSTFNQKFEYVHNCNDETADPLVLRDVGLQQHPNTAASLDFLRQRFMKNVIYTTTDPLLVAINPFKDLGLCTDTWIKKYREAQDVTRLPPHTFAIARMALDNLHAVNISQTIIVTGESGAGKTEATKHCMRFFASARSGMDLRIQNAVMAANPVLEAFGNAKTIKNNNSSRFGRFMQLIVASGGGIVNGEVKGFLLEKVRVVSQEKDERSYHIFYQLLKGADAGMRERYRLKDLGAYKNLVARSGGCFEAPGIDDVSDWRDVLKSFESMGMSTEEIDSILSVVSGVLLLGNVSFVGQTVDGQDNAACFQPGAEAVLAEACRLMYIDDVEKVALALRQTKKMAGREEVMVRVQKNEAEMLASSLSKAMYDNLFGWIIERLNRTIKPAEEFTRFMGMLDIFGFEIFENNSLEQLLINITNEYLQKNFVDIVFEQESRLYRNEGVSTAELVFTSNKEIIETLIGKKTSVFACLKDACAAKMTDESFVSTMRLQLNPHVFKLPMAGGELKFTICHIIANIDYSAKDFISKNVDILKADLAEVLKASTNPVIQELSAPIPVIRGNLGQDQQIAAQFQKQLDIMMNIILKTESHFIRCIKPNETKRPLDWNNRKVLNQLTSLSIIEALQLKKLGFSFRREYRDFCRIFRYLDMGVNGEMEACPQGQVERERQIAMKMLVSMSKYFKKEEFRDTKEWQVGKTMIFMKPEVVQQLYVHQRRTMEKLTPAATLIESCYARYKRREELKVAVKPVIRTQARCRQVLTKQCGVLPTCQPRGYYAPNFRLEEIHI